VVPSVANADDLYTLGQKQRHGDSADRETSQWRVVCATAVPGADAIAVTKHA